MCLKHHTYKYSTECPLKLCKRFYALIISPCNNLAIPNDHKRTGQFYRRGRQGYPSDATDGFTPRIQKIEVISRLAGENEIAVQSGERGSKQSSDHVRGRLRAPGNNPTRDHRPRHPAARPHRAPRRAPRYGLRLTSEEDGRAERSCRHVAARMTQATTQNTHRAGPRRV